MSGVIIQKVAVIGFGLMGAQISQLLAQKGLSVTATDSRSEALQAGLRIIKEGKYGLDQLVSRKKLSEEDAKKAYERIKTVGSIKEACTDADFVIEAVYESLDLKKEIFKELDKVCKETAILTSNTSTLSITEIASVTARPDRVAGMHFFIPPQVMRLIEIIRGLLTSNAIIETVKALAEQLGKTPIVAKDSPGFATSRLGITLFLEASRMLEESVASIRDIDLGMKLGYGYPMGPFELADLVGLDTRISIIESLYQSTKDPKWKTPILLKQLVASGYIGDPKIKANSKGGYYEFFRLERPNV